MGRIRDKIMRKLGFENIENIGIKWDFYYSTVNPYKMMERSHFYNTYKEFQVPIILDNNNILVDGYTSYLIALERGIKYVPVERK